MITLDPSSPVPPFEQLRMQLAAQIESGELAAGTRLSTVRRMADDLAIAPGTVARAYRELEATHHIETRGRHGSFVAAQPDLTAREAERAASAFAERIRALGLDADAAIALARQALTGP